MKNIPKIGDIVKCSDGSRRRVISSNDQVVGYQLEFESHSTGSIRETGSPKYVFLPSWYKWISKNKNKI